MSRPAPTVRAIGALTALELRLTARRGENVLVTLVIPAAVLLFFASTSIVPIVGEPVAFLLPGAIALGIIAAGLVNLGIATAYERQYGVLKRLGGSPLPRWGLLGAKVIAILVLEAVQVIILVAVATLGLDWQPGPGWSPLLVVVAVLLGTTTFAGLGLLLAGTLRAEATLALANGMFLAFLMLGGVVVRLDQLPAALQPLAAILPATALTDLFRIAFDSAASGSEQLPLGPAAILVAWSVGAAALAVRWFRWA